MLTHKVKINNGKESKWPSRPKMSELLESAKLIPELKANEDGFITGALTDYTNNRVTSIRKYAFYYLDITSANLPSVTSIDSYGFSNCSKLTHANFPSVTNIGYNSFAQCTSLKTADFPLLTTIGGSAFFNCTSLTSVNFPSVTDIDASALSRCLKLTTIDLPSIQNIGTTAFQICSTLTSLILRPDSICKLNAPDALDSTPIKSGTGYIYVPSALVDTYKAASNWSTYAAQFRALEDYTVDGTTTGALDETKI